MVDGGLPCSLIRSLDGAVDGLVSSVINIVVVGNQFSGDFPVVNLRGPGCVGHVSGVMGQACGDVEETPVGNGVLVVVTIVQRENLPFKSTSASILGQIPSSDVIVEHCLYESQPLRLACRRIRELVFCGRHCCHGPKSYIESAPCEQ
jgi:hypothetical protein